MRVNVTSYNRDQGVSVTSYNSVQGGMFGLLKWAKSLRHEISVANMFLSV